MSNNAKQMTVVEHLEELRARLIKVLVVLAAVSSAGYFFSEPVLSFLTAPGRPAVDQFYFFGPSSAFLVRLKIAVFSGTVLCSPYILYHIWMFVAPGLFAHEQKALIPTVLAASALFLLGAAFAYALALPAALGFLLSCQTSVLRPLMDIDRYLSFSMTLILAFGVVFDLPVFVIGLVRVGVLNSTFLRHHRKSVIVGAFVLAAILTPPDVFTQIMLALPLTALYEISIWCARWMESRKGKKKS